MPNPSIVAARLLVSLDEARKRIHQQVQAGEPFVGRSVEMNWGVLETFSADKRIWADYTHDLLLTIFDSSEFATEFFTLVESQIESGSVGDFIRAEKYSIVRALGYLRSIEKRLDLLKEEKQSVAGRIPLPVIALVSDVLQAKYTHARLDGLMKKVGIRGDAPEGNKAIKCRDWLERANSGQNPLATLGKVLEELMEVDSFGIGLDESIETLRTRITQCLSKFGLAYAPNGQIVTAGGVAASRLEEIIRSHDLMAMQIEFERLSRNVEADPPAAVTASSALLESLFQIYIEDQQLELPSDKSIKPLWNVVRKDLRLDPSLVQDEDLRKVLSGLASIVDGIGSLRTHKGSAHGQGRRGYKLQPRHARLVVHAASTLASFVIEAWDQRRKQAANTN